MKPRQIALAAALLGAAALLAFGDRNPASEVAEAAPRRAAPLAARSASAAAAKSVKGAQDATAEPSILPLIPREELVGAAGEAAFDGGDAVFLSQNWTPPPPKVTPPPPPPPPPPRAPPLPFTFIGKAVDAGVWEVFLARADQTYIVREKSVIDGLYRVVTIAPPVLTITYLPLNQVQQLNIGVLD